MSADGTLVTHSSLKPVLRLGIEAELPGYPAQIGLQLADHETQPGHYLLIQAPSLSSLETGEMISFSPDTSPEDALEELDTRLRAGLLTLAQGCRTLAEDLLSHAARLETEARKEVLISKEGVATLPTPRPKQATPVATLSTPPSEDLDIFGD